MRKNYIIVAASVFLVILAGIILFIWARQSSTGTIKDPQKSAEVEKASTPVKIDTAYFTAILPPGFVVKSNTENASSQDLIQIVATRPSSNGQQISISVGTLPKEGIGAVSSYNLRVSTPETYKKTEFAGMPSGLTTFYSQSQTAYEITSFWVRGGLYAMVSASGLPTQKDDINQSLVTMFANWQWR